MYEITVKHKYCGMEKIIYGYSAADAFKREGLEYDVWFVTNIEYID